MIMDRVEINGIWYVREDLTSPTTTTSSFEFVEEEYVERNVAHTEHLIYEDGDYMLELSGLVVNRIDERVAMTSLVIFDKQSGKRECWDNEAFLRKLADLDSEQIEIAMENDGDVVITYSLLNTIINLLKMGVEKGIL